MSKRTISINPQFFNISKKKKKIIPSEVNINASNIRQMLLDKLKEHKKTRKIETTPKSIPILQDKTFEESCKDVENEKITATTSVSSVPSENENISDSKDSNCESKDKPYGNLKNGTKPTYKMYQSQTEPIQIVQPEPEKQIILEEKEVKKTFKLGKSGRTISVLIKNNKTRKKVEDKKSAFQKRLEEIAKAKDASKNNKKK
jgi:hypothetical protein